MIGICRGCQLINVLLGGDLYQDLPAQLNVRHSDPEMRHDIDIAPGSALHKLYGAKLSVNSTHHQAVRNIASGLAATAFSCGDRIIEAFEHDALPVWGYQFHPERGIASGEMCSPDFMPLFIDFVKRVRAHNAAAL
jgi:putative glutamine amidotransferase